MLRLVCFSMLVGFLALLLSGCGPERLGFGQEATPPLTPTAVPVPTFTPTPLSLPTATALSALLEPTAVPTVAVVQAIITAAEPVTDTIASAEGAPATALDDEAVATLLPTATVPPATATPVDAAQVIVRVETANVRNGPSTEYLAVGAVANGEAYPLTGRNAPGDWWQICCFAGQPGWIYGTLVEVQNAELVAEVTDLPPLPVQPTPVPVAEAVPNDDAPAADVPAEPAPEAPATTDTSAHSGTAGNFDLNAQYQIVHYRVLGFEDNNGGIFNKGGQQFIFVAVLDQNGSPVDGAVVKDAVGDKLNVITGDKGPGKAEIKMDWDPYKLYVAADPSGAVTSQISNQMNNPYPHIPDVVGLLGPPDNEYAICPTIDDRCEPPFYHAHWSYEITFQRVQ